MCLWINAHSIHQHYEYFAVTSSLLTGWFGHLQPYVTRTWLSNYLWYLTLHNNSWFFFFFRSSQQSIRTLTTGYALSSLFVPGDRHVVVGTKVYQFRWDSFLLFGQRWQRACTSFKSLTWGAAVRVLTFHVARVKAWFSLAHKHKRKHMCKQVRTPAT